jgi:glutamate synthase domain-containing protein 3
MTKGTVAILGATGRNLASGMTGGELFVLREHAQRRGPTPLVLHELDEETRTTLRLLLTEHAQRTASARARELLEDDLTGFVRLATTPASAAAVVSAPAAAASGSPTARR